MTPRVSYRDAGVDLRAAETLTSRIAALVEGTRTSGVRAGFGSFAGRFVVKGDPELVASADGVGTKVLVATRTKRYDSVGEDLVNHCVNDVLAEGATPLFFLDYLACGSLDPELAYAVLEGVARGCRQNECALLGGETAEMPGVYGVDEFDLAGFVVGRRQFDFASPAQLRAGDALVGLASSGFHTNGYSLIRRILFEQLELRPEEPFPGMDACVADVLLRVHRSYLPHLREECEKGRVRALAHITGGGLPGNLSRLLSPTLDARIDLSSWKPGPEFQFFAEYTALSREDLYETLNMGLGIVAITADSDADDCVAAVQASGCPAFRCGTLVAGSGRVHLDGTAW